MKVTIDCGGRTIVIVGETATLITPTGDSVTLSLDKMIEAAQQAKQIQHKKVE